jgi:hypothetical protein
VSKKILVWIFLHVEALLTRAIRIFQKLAFRVAGSQGDSKDRGSQPARLSVASGEVGFVITTFEKRFELYALPLIASIRRTVPNPIYLIVNANYDGPASSRATRSLIRGLAEYENVFPIFFGEMQGCASLWNTGLKHSRNNANFILNDDISIDEKTFAEEVKLAASLLQSHSLITINKSWSHFLISSKCIKEFGDFDERFLGFGQEDGDYIRRVTQKNGTGPHNIFLPGFINLIDHSREESIADVDGKYSLFNQCLIQLKYPNEKVIESFSLGLSKDGLPNNFDHVSIRDFREKLYPMLRSENPQEIITAIVDFYS